ncbi:MAG: DUF4190 domain-containing protein [Planctomycetota bacterium]|jgi:hypothetical protein
MKPDKSSNGPIDEPQGREARTSSLAVLAFILSIVSIAPVFIPTVVPCLLVPFVAIPSIVLGCIALITIKRSKGELRGNWMAGIGIAVSFVWVTFFLVFVPVLRKVGRCAYEVKRKAQLLSIDTAIELFRSEFDYYPPSDAMDEAGVAYCGAMKLSEAVMGQDLLGCHPDSVFRSDGTDGAGKVLYPDNSGDYWHEPDMRKGPYLPLETANAYLSTDLYGEGKIGPFDPNHFVLCDVWKRVTRQSSGKKVGMPILYYRADTSKTTHDVKDPNNPESIYDYRDNHALLALGVPGKPGQKHPLFENPRIFYEMTRDYKAAGVSRPKRGDTYILLSAGSDGLYGTQDDVANFHMRWKPE